jgi:hypothetical protein
MRQNLRNQQRNCRFSCRFLVFLWFGRRGGALGHPAGPSNHLQIAQQILAGKFQDSECLFPGDAFKSVEELVERFPSRYGVEQFFSGTRVP